MSSIAASAHSPMPRLRTLHGFTSTSPPALSSNRFSCTSRSTGPDAPSGNHAESVSVVQSDGQSEPHIVHLNITNPEDAASLHGFVESNNVVSIEAEHCTSTTASGAIHWERLPVSARHLGPRKSFRFCFPALQLASMEHPSTTACISSTPATAPTLNFAPGRGLRQLWQKHSAARSPRPMQRTAQAR